ncbi:MAG: pyruvate kinase [Gemmatimonadaceae bacterium]|nr:pyruvate kinase [Gemmatimonadaceae bacterium]
MPPRYTPRTKVVGTLGPASNTREAITALIEAGLDVARINFSHGTHEQHAATIALVRDVARELSKPVAILGDLQGPRIRIGALDEPIAIEVGQEVVLAPEEIAIEGEIPVTYDQLAGDVQVKGRILIDDGLLELRVTDVTGQRVRAVVVHGGSIRSSKGMNLPGIEVSAPSITEKDRADVAFAVEQGLDMLALSFVRRAWDIDSLRAMVNKGMFIVAKIEKDVALKNIESILRAADGVMVARGDLGVELPFEEVPLAQKTIIQTATRLGKPVITATQMLESMIENPRPTRAEASDVANAILDGTDAVMLSAETAAGAYPRLAVEAMRRIIKEIETNPTHHREDRRAPSGTVTTEVAIAAATVAAVKMLKSPLVVVFTRSGTSARVVSSHRPPVPLLVLTDQASTARQLALVWGVVPVLVPAATDYDVMWDVARREALARNLAEPGDRVIVTFGAPFGKSGSTNLMKVEAL